MTGILWILLGLFVLQARYDSAVAIGVMIAIWLIFGGVDELMQAGLLEGWRWLHIVVGVLFVIGGVAALTSPFQTFMVLASLVGIFLVIKGTFDFALALMARPPARSVVDDAHRRDHRDPARVVGDGIPGSIGGAAHRVGRLRCDRAWHRRDRRQPPGPPSAHGGDAVKLRAAAISAVVAASAMSLVGCSTEARAERKGKEFGEQICKAKDADSPEEAQRHIDNANDKLEDLIRFTGRDVREDLREIDQQLTQMTRGAARDQDVNAIVRSVQDAPCVGPRQHPGRLRRDARSTRQLRLNTLRAAHAAPLPRG